MFSTSAFDKTEENAIMKKRCILLFILFLIIILSSFYFLFYYQKEEMKDNGIIIIPSNLNDYRIIPKDNGGIDAPCLKILGCEENE